MRVSHLTAMAMAVLLAALPSTSCGAEGASLTLSVKSIASDSVTLEWTAEKKCKNYALQAAAEPPGETGESLPDAVALGNPASDTKSLKVDHLAASTDIFFELSATCSGKQEKAYAYARTEGGPRARLATPLRSVHLYAPDILMLVVSGGDGKTWQTGKWTLKRRDGSSIAIGKVHRQTIPVSAPGYKVGWGIPYSDDIIDVDHHLFLELDQPVGSRDMLRLTGPAKLDVLIPYSDKYLETPAIKVNQVGYAALSKKRYAYVSGFMGDGGALSLNRFPPKASVLAEPEDPLDPRNERASGLAIAHRNANDPDAGGPVREINLSNLPAAEGVTLRVHVPGVGVSWPTAISDKAFFKAFYVVTRGLYHNRWGVNRTPSTTAWPRKAGHTFVYTGEKTVWWEMYPETQPKTGKRPLVGGYFDAGDFDQRPTHTVVPMLLMSAFESHKLAFGDKQLTLPESGNGIPDLLDEALWGVRAWEQLQDENGGVRLGAESHRHPYGYYLASEDPLPYWTYAKDASTSARAAGLFAQAARLVREYDNARAEELRSRAERAYAYAEKNGASFAFLLYASGELFRLTGENRYKVAFENNWDAIGPYGAFSRFSDRHPMLGAYRDEPSTQNEAFTMTDYLMSYLASGSARPDIAETTRKWLQNYANGIVETVENAHAFRNARPPVAPNGWGQAATMGRYTDTIIGYLRMGNPSAAERRSMTDTLYVLTDYVLGCNPLGMVFFTGLGSRHVEEPVHLDSLAYVKMGMGPVAGVPVYGPVDGPPGHYWSKSTVATYYPDMQVLPPAMRYGDVRTLITTNEFTVWEVSAPQIKLFSVLIGYGQSPPQDWLPGNPGATSPLPW